MVGAARSATIAIRSAKSATLSGRTITFGALTTTNALVVETLVAQQRCVIDAIDKFDRAIAATTAKITDYALFEALPGAGPTLASRLLVAFGEQRDRYHDAAQIQKYSGIQELI